VAAQPGLVLKGASMPYTSVNGNMFSFLTAEGTLALRFSYEERQEFVEKYHTRPVIQHGALMKEYVEVPEALLNDREELSDCFNKSFNYAASLKPKQVKRKSSSSGG
jgi:TfoX/Sxy family transcriptional regulator of competence genes